MEAMQRPFYPIIYVRGYAGTEAEVEETVATPYMGFNLGATKVRQRWDGEVVRHVFESPLVRLMKDFDYRDIYSDGDTIHLESAIQPRSIIIYRYYDQVSKDLGTGERPEIEVFAEGLSRLILDVRHQICDCGGIDPAIFKVILVAHSMGGLICRAFLQNPALGAAQARACVDKVFTYATPHNGIELKVLGNVPSFFTKNNADNFNRERMRAYLDLPDDVTHVADLNDTFDPKRFFCLVGTNSKDYTAAAGWSSRLVGPASDGLVRIENASVRGSPRAMVHRSHSGNYGIVNSEEGYQNLSRFLFGDVRVDGKLLIAELSLPPRVEQARKDGKKIRASYHFEAVVRPRGARYDLHRRLVEEESAIFRTFEELFEAPSVSHPHLFSVYLSKDSRTRGRRRSRSPLVFAIDVKVRVPDYEIDGFLMFDDHIEGATLFNETLIVAAVPPEDEDATWEVRYGFNPGATNPTPRAAQPAPSADGVAFHIPLESPANRRPGMKAILELLACPWR